MKIAYNPLGSAAYIPAADNKDLIFDLVTRTIYAKGIPFDGTKYNTFKKHTSPDNTGGSEGLVPIPSYSALNNRLLREDGQWVQIAGVSAPDDALSLESTNPVENKVITKKFNEIIAQLLLKAEHVYKNIVINGVLLQAQGANDTLTIIQGDGITITPNTDNKSITISTKALGQQGIDISYSEGQLIAKVADTYYARWNEVFNWYRSVTEEDTDQYINKWQEIVDFLNNVQQGTNILDEFVTRKTDQTIIGTKTFNQQIISTVAEGISPFVVDSSTRVLKLNADMVDNYHIRKWFDNASDIDDSAVLWQSNGECSDIPSMSYSALINVIGGTGRRWQIWNSRNNHQLYWRPELSDMSGYAPEHILLDSLNYKGFIEQMYWANVSVSSTSSTTTSPTFAIATVTTQVTTPKVHSSGRLTLNATGKGLDLKVNNDDTKSVILNGIAFKPFDAANGNLDLGASNARWKVIYGGAGNFVGNVISTVSDATYVSHIVQNSNGAVSIYAATNRGLYDATNSAWIIYLSQAADHVYVPKWASRGSSTQPIYFNASGEPIACTAYSGLLTALSSSSSINLSITVGGTTKSITDLYARKLALSSTTITSTANDTTAKWGPLGTSVHFYATTGQLTNQPSQYGLLLNVTTGSSEVHQIWMTQSSGNLCHRGGNSAGWSGSWRTILDSSNYTSIIGSGTYWKVNGQTTVGTGDIYLEMWRGISASWKMINNGGTLRFQCNYTSAAGSYYDALTVTYNTGNVWTKGSITSATGHFSSSTTTYINSASGCSIIFRPGGTEKVRILKDSGYVGIGITSPTARLHVVGDSKFTDTIHVYADSTGNYTEGIRLYGIAKDSTWSVIQFGCDPAATSGTHANQWLFGRDTSNRLVFRNNTSDKIYITTAGNMGIGVAPIHKLQVAGAGVFSNTGSTTYASNGITIGAGDAAARYITCYGKTGLSYINIGYNAVANNSGELHFNYSSSGSTSNYVGLQLYGAANSVKIYPGYTQSVKYISAPNYVSSAATGTQPYACTSTTLNTNLNADMLDGYHRSNLFTSYVTWMEVSELNKSITVGGNADTYYPVVISVSSSKLDSTRISVWKNLGSTTPSYSGNHSNGTSSLWLIYEGRNWMWDGNGGFIKTWYKYQGYATLIAHAEQAGSAVGNLVLYLRGGGCQYNIACSNRFTATVYTASTNIGSSSYPVNVAPRTTIGNGGIIQSRLGYGSVDSASTATLASTVTVNNSDANSTYRMVWHSGNTLFSTAGIYCNPSTDYLYAASMQTSNWFRSTGNTGWYSQDYGGGWYMIDSTWIRTYGNKSIYQNTGILRTDGTLQVGQDGAYLNWNSSGGKMMNRVIIDSIGRISPNTTGVRRAGMYGIYDSHKIGHIWSMGTSYMIPDDGSTFGNLYGLAYKHTNNTTGGTMASGHMLVWCQNGTPYCALGTNMWTSGNSYAAHFYENSDINLKTNIEAISTSDNIPQLKEFDWKSDGSHSYGLIAQELEKMGYSELVDNSGEHKTVNYSAALSLIVGKLQVKIKELEKEIEILKNKN